MVITQFKRATQMALFLLCSVSSAQSLFEQFFSEGISLQGMGTESRENVEFHWTETKNSHVLLITPKGNKDIPLDIQIKDGLVQVSGKVVKQEAVERDGVKTQSSYLSPIFFGKVHSPGGGLGAGTNETGGSVHQNHFP